MKGYYLSWKKIAFYIFVIAVISMLAFMSSIRMANDTHLEEVSFNFCLAAGITQGITATIPMLPIIILSLLNFTIFQFAFGRIVDSDFFECSYYMLTRQKSKTIWYMKKVTCLFGVSFLYNLLYYCVGFITIILFGVEPITISSSIVLLAEIIVTSTLFIFIFTLLISVLSIAINRITALYSVNLLLVLSALVSAICFTNKAYSILRFNLIANIMPCWHMLSELPLNENPSIMMIDNFTHTFSIIYFAILAVIVTIVGVIAVNKKDVF